ncbi:hypothetical protein [Pseudactinotalea terrae]|uniref:hypothetical protein n=1 Tax=Pseudactinotalea terrae TaxID=1743262 RepID=UPI0012E2DB1B|nr:hypothetical protein [Pseudactinotalea terrae]
MAALTEADPPAFPGLVNGGATPFGHEDSISGPLESLTAIAERIDPKTDGFSLERDDAAIAATFGGLFS